MSGALVVTEVRDGVVSPRAGELISAGVLLSGSSGVTVLYVGESALAEPLTLAGVNHVVAVSSAGDYTPAALTQAVEQQMAQQHPRAVLFAHGPEGMSVAPALAVAHGGDLITDVIALEVQDGAVRATREYFGGKLAGDTILNEALAVLTIRPGAFVNAEGHSSAEISEMSLPDNVTAIRYLGTSPPLSGVDLASAELVLAVGRGVEDREALGRLAEVAQQLGATLAGSRPLVDSGWLEPSRQVGQSGCTVKPRVYLALGISGSVQHLVGMRDSEVIIAVNKDADAPIFRVAHYGAVADLHTVARGLGATVS